MVHQQKFAKQQIEKVLADGNADDLPYCFLDNDHNTFDVIDITCKEDPALYKLGHFWCMKKLINYYDLFCNVQLYRVDYTIWFIIKKDENIS